MDLVEAIVWWGLIALGGLAIAGVLAGVKNRDVSFWMGWCFLLPPLALCFFCRAFPGRGPTRHFSTTPIRPAVRCWPKAEIGGRSLSYALPFVLRLALAWVVWDARPTPRLAASEFRVLLDRACV
jgi:hypothetical protein